MYNDLKKVLQKENITVAALAKFLGVCEKTAQNKINGNSDFKYSEALKICKHLLPGYTFSYLFWQE